MKDPNEIDADKRRPLPGDQTPVALTTYQAIFIGAILSALADGHEGWTQYLPLISRFLNTTAMVANGVHTRPTPSVLWAQIEELPWPPNGGPRPQPA